MPDAGTERRKARVERELERLLGRGETPLDGAMRYAVLGGGKRYRPLLTLAAAAALGGDEAEGLALPFAAAIELIHAYSLVHDDLPCMDDDDTRRGRPACHKAFGENVALLAGDALLTRAFEAMAAAPVPRRLLPRKIEVILETARLAGVGGMIGGQLLDITFGGSCATAAGLTEIMLKKTGALITLAARAGALLGGAGPRQLRALTAFGKNVGLAFQVRDDIQDAVAPGAGAGKRKAPASSGRGNSGPGRAGGRGALARSPRAAGRSRAPLGRGAGIEPNYAAVFGSRAAEERLGFLVRGALAALDGEGIESPALRRLAKSLLIR